MKKFLSILIVFGFNCAYSAFDGEIVEEKIAEESSSVSANSSDNTDVNKSTSNSQFEEASNTPNVVETTENTNEPSKFDIAKQAGADVGNALLNSAKDQASAIASSKAEEALSGAVGEENINTISDVANQAKGAYDSAQANATASTP